MKEPLHVFWYFSEYLLPDLVTGTLEAIVGPASCRFPTMTGKMPVLLLLQKLCGDFFPHLIMNSYARAAFAFTPEVH
ncbi:MAG TPA: hypothetical protein VMC85_21935 [Desulfomonilaceae bacterium]|nr:hypothetical protein [Desulfomonilaceae bacterium]